MSIRTDLILENRPMNGDISGVESTESEIDGIKINKTVILNSTSAKALGRPKGRYFTVTCDRFDRLCDINPIKKSICSTLKELLPNNSGSALIAGLGNRDITPDAIGPLSADGIMATRHIDAALKATLGFDDLREVSVIIPGVLGKTGMEAAETIKSAVQRINPDFVIVIDALAARRSERLCSTIQICDTGISPGSGVNNSRKAINSETLGVSVVAMGIPTVIDASTFSTDCGTECGSRDMMVTPKEIDLLISKGATILSEALNCFLQPSLDEETLRALG